MMNEKIRKEINLMINDLNDALIRTFEHVDKYEQEAYDRGLNDCWNAIKKIILPNSQGGLTIDELESIFGTIRYQDILINFTPIQTIEKIRGFQEKKKEAEKKIEIGDMVTVSFIRPDTNFQICIKGMVVANYLHKIVILTKDKHLHEFDKLCGNLNVIKTGKHVDILRFIEE